MILSDVDIIKLIEEKKLIIEPSPERKDIKEANIDLHLSNKVLRYKNNIADLKDDSTFIFEEISLNEPVMS